MSDIFFSYELIEGMKESRELYLLAINELYANASKGDSIIIFEDVLYYGIKSKPDDFKSFNLHLLELRNSGSNVIVAYYNPTSMVFHKMIQEGRFPSFIKAMQQERKQTLDSMNIIQKTTYADYMYVDSLLSEKYFALERDANPQKYHEEIHAYLRPIHKPTDGTPLTRAEQDINEMCMRIDSVKRHYLGNEDKVTYADYQAMYHAMSNEVVRLYAHYGFELVPLNDYLMMSCWLAGEKIIFAFPSKYNTDEIGFSSQDPAFSKYVRTMLEGVTH